MLTKAEIDACENCNMSKQEAKFDSRNKTKIMN